MSMSLDDAKEGLGRALANLHVQLTEAQTVLAADTVGEDEKLAALKSIVGILQTGLQYFDEAAQTVIEFATAPPPPSV